MMSSTSIPPNNPTGIDAATAYQRAVDLVVSHGDAESWRAGMGWLGKAVAMGHRDAATQMALLDQWTDQHLWPQTPEPRPLCGAPVILVLTDLLPPAMCQWLVERAEKLVRPAQVYDETTGTGRADSGRTNSSGKFVGPDADMIVGLARRRISQASGVPVVGFEHTQVLTYEIGQSFDWHVDFLDPAIPGFATDLRQRGQRIVTCLIYLNNDFEGGETAFATPDLRHRGRKGEALMWSNVLPNGQVDRHTVHAGLPPTSGRKWVLSQWIRDRAPRND
ncbi:MULTISPECIES: prolyl hydroxylase family protein [unclassified Brevundimonas]|uniref:prolyl hydroxylase family protein n=1 Tax=unclassified Brevundimonas TaxID=2622653 RepID=UPI0025BDFBBE|nr:MULTISPECIES: 2OG-Fe(II) oxygenase [unclassified Brevundimonas]